MHAKCAGATASTWNWPELIKKNSQRTGVSVTLKPFGRDCRCNSICVEIRRNVARECGRIGAENVEASE